MESGHSNHGSVKLLPRVIVLIVAGLLACAVIALLTFTLQKDGNAAVLLLDYSNLTVFPYPFTIQNAMHVLFFVGVGEIVVRGQVAVWEQSFLREKFLPEDDQTILQAEDLGPIRRKVAHRFDDANGFLPYLIDLSILQFYASRSVDQVVNILNSSLELIAHRVDLRYSFLRYLVWVIPTIGFIGTVVGIAGALATIDPSQPDLKAVTANLGVAFNTTIIALMESAVLVLLLSVVQKREEESVSLAGNYCLKNLVNRLYEAPK
jgi:biopolymer transport protein ExbB/TolQ